MEIDRDRIDDAVLGLMWLTLHDEWRAWIPANGATAFQTFAALAA